MKIGRKTSLLRLPLIALSGLQVATSFAPIPSLTLQNGLHKQCKFYSPNNKFIKTTLQRSNQWQIQATTDEEKEEEERKKKIREEIFWAKQRALAAEMGAKSDAALKK
jgi:hypothetical protein